MEILGSKSKRKRSADHYWKRSSAVRTQKAVSQHWLGHRDRSTVSVSTVIWFFYLVFFFSYKTVCLKNLHGLRRGVGNTCRTFWHRFSNINDEVKDESTRNAGNEKLDLFLLYFRNPLRNNDENLFTFVPDICGKCIQARRMQEEEQKLVRRTLTI